jgi:uncharacterized protein YcbK (DUF882 family)
MAKLSHKNIKVTLKIRLAGKDQLLDFVVMNGSFSLSEQDKSSSCEISVYDNQHITANKILEKIKVDGGIIVPPDLFKELDKADTQTSITNGLQGDELATVIVNYCRGSNIKQVEQIAYILATADHESKMGLYTSEIGGESISYAPYYGRGLVQITHQDNYERWGKYLNQDFITNKELVSDLKYAVPILCLGMTGLNGAPNFTGRVLSEYINGSSVDYINARRTVNGTDRAALIADIAKRYETRLRAGELTGGTVQTVSPFAALTATSTIITDTKFSDAVKQAEKFSELTLYVSYNDQPPVRYDYVFTGIEKEGEHTTVISGQSIDAAITLTTSTTKVRTYNNTSLRMFSDGIAKELGLKLDITETRLSEQIIQQFDQYPGESKYEVLGRLAKRQGYFIRNSGTVLKLEPLIGDSVSYLIKPTDLLSVPRLIETATQNRITSKGLAPIVQGLSLVVQKGTAPDSLSEYRTEQEKLYVNNIQGDLEIGEGFRLSCSVKEDSRIHTLQPGAIVNVPGEGDFRLKRRSHSVNSSKVTLELYLPVWVESSKKDIEVDTTSQRLTSNSAINYTPTPGKLSGTFTLPGLNGKYDSNTTVVNGGFITWSQVCKDERRQFLTAEITKNLINITGEVERYLKLYFSNRLQDVTVTSGFRDEASNQSVGGATASQHILGKALDLYIVGETGKSLSQRAISFGWNGGIGIYTTLPEIIHLDIGTKRSWGL